MKSKHTPRPWHQSKGGSNLNSYSQSHGVINLESKTLVAGIFFGIPGGEETAEANAKLIASSPELLAALQNLVGAITIQSPNLDKNIADAYAAIKKATE